MEEGLPQQLVKQIKIASGEAPSRFMKGRVGVLFQVVLARGLGPIFGRDREDIDEVFTPSILKLRPKTYGLDDLICQPSKLLEWRDDQLEFPLAHGAKLDAGDQGIQ